MPEPDKSASLGWQGVALVAIVVGAVAFLGWYAMRKYATATDAATVLAVIVGPLVALGAAGFGIKLTADAKAETAATKKEAAKAADELEKLGAGGPDEGPALKPSVHRHEVQPAIDRLRRLST